VDIGFCGSGLMGTPMVRRLLSAGHRVVVWNRDRAKAERLTEAGAAVAKSPAALAADCEAVFLCLTDQSAVEAVVFGDNGVAGGSGAKWLVDHSSISPASTRSFAQALEDANGMLWVDAPVSGGVPGAEAGTLAIMAGGAVGAVSAVKGVMMSYARSVTHMGSVGAGQVTKLCNQAIVTTTISVIAEAVTLAENSGIDAAHLTAALAGGWADSTLLQVFVPRMTTGYDRPLGTVNTMLKDLNNIAAAAMDTETPMPAATAAHQNYRIAVAKGLGQSDVAEIVQVFRSR
jgi:2-hydroxy-3-oxopropionate reductase